MAIVVKTPDGDSFGSEICKALGLKASEVTGLNIRIRSGDLVSVTVCLIVTNDQARELTEIFKKYRLELAE